MLVAAEAPLRKVWSAAVGASAWSVSTIGAAGVVL